MITIIAVMVCGILVGIFVKGIKGAVVGKVINYLVFLLLLLLGLSVGSNPDVTENLMTIGVTAAIITTFAVVGSVVAAAIIYNKFFKDER